MSEHNHDIAKAQIQQTPSRFRNTIAKYKVYRGPQCKNCATCVVSCPKGVHFKAGTRLALPHDYLCVGPDVCHDQPYYCVSKCPYGALKVGPNPLINTLGDYRWTAELLMSTYYQAETGELPEVEMEHRVGNSGGGFDKLRFRFPERPPVTLGDDEIDTSIDLNNRGDNAHKITIPIPVYQGGMSFGSVSNNTMISRATAAKLWGTFCCTGEGGYPEFLYPFDDNMITQVATGLFGVKEETIQRVKIIEFKYAQGAKPGLGGHLLGDKVTEAVARMREAVKGSALFSPFPFHSVYSVEDHKKHVDWIKAMNPKALVSVKVSTPADVDMVAIGSYYAGAHIVHLDGSYGGTGAAPDIAKKNIAMPIEYAIPKVHRFLVAEGVRDKVTLIASGGVRTAHDILKAIALGADGVVEGTAGLVALECTRCSSCESGRGCPRGIATTDEELKDLIAVEWGVKRIYNLYASWRKQMVDILKKFGMRSIRELVGRTDCLRHLDYE
jgi:glutamate synthase domain-containing protein 2/ferredoxin